jgi:hypothetical protein
MRDLSDNVVQTVDVLNVDRRVNVDAAAQQLLNVKIPLWVTAAGRICVGEFVDKHDLRPASDDPVKVHFVQPLALVLDSSTRDDFKTLQ